MIKVGIFNWFGYRIESQKRFNMIKQAGFDTVMLYWGDEYIESEGEKELLPDLARKAGLEIENIHAPFSNANDIWIDSVNGKELIDLYSMHIKDCRRFGIGTIVLHVSSGKNPPPVNAIGINRFRYLTELAQDEGISIALENIRSPDYLDKIFSRIFIENLGLCYDSGHENCYTSGLDLLDKFGRRLKALHLHDNNGIEDQHRIPGEGTVNWEYVRKGVINSSYRGSITLEVTNEFSQKYANLEAELFLKEAYNKVQEILVKGADILSASGR